MIKNLHRSLRSVLSLPRFAKQTIAIVTDISLCIITLWIALFLRLDSYQFANLNDSLKWASVISVLIAIPLFWLMGMYRYMFRYSGISVIGSVSFSILVYGLLYFSVISIFGIKGVPRSIGILQPILFLFAILSSRLFAERVLVGNFKSKTKEAELPRTLIYGAGSAGRQLLQALKNTNEMKVVGFVDDDLQLQGQLLDNQNIFSSNDLGKLIETKKVNHILLALPSVKRNRRLQILKNINKYKVKVKTLPSVSDIIKDRVTLSDIRELDIEDILDRKQVSPNIELLNKNINSKCVLITGAGGSIGSELCRQIIKLNPTKILLLDISEYSLYKIRSELEDLKKSIESINKSVEIVPILASVQDKIRMTDIVKTLKPDNIYHTAAYKHVPIVEENLYEGIKNNVFGTLITAQVAIENNVSSMVLISTDKAVRPTNVMGATKRLAEICLQSLYEESNKSTKLSMVRFGNVIDSSGSVIPKFKQQIRNGGPITLTHPEVTRYFMSIPEAAQLVIQAGSMSEGCDVFVLDMGEPLKIIDLIKRIVRLSGLSISDEQNPDGDIKIKITGLRPGEKLFEELLLGEDPQDTIHNKIKKAQDPFIKWSELKISLEDLRYLVDKNNIKEILNILEKLIVGFKPNLNIVDKIYTEKKKNINNLREFKKSKSQNIKNIINLNK